MTNTCKYCNNSFESKTSTKRYCSNKCENDDRKLKIKLNNIEWYIYKENYNLYPDYYLLNRIKYGDAHKNKCCICGIEYKKDTRTCSSICNKKLREKTCIQNFGNISNFSSDICKNEIKNIIKEKYNVENVFQLQEVKDKIKNTLIKRYNVNNPSYHLDVKIKRQKTGELNGTRIPTIKKTEWEIYKLHVHTCTRYNVNRFGFKYWGNNFIKKWSKYDHHVDHIYSVYDGFINKIPAYIIASFSNLRFIDAKENIKKGKKSLSTKEELLENYYNFFITEYEKSKPLTDKLINIINEHNIYLNETK